MLRNLDFKLLMVSRARWSGVELREGHLVVLKYVVIS